MIRLLNYIISLVLVVFTIGNLKAQEFRETLEKIDHALLSFEPDVAFDLINSYEHEHTIIDSNILFELKLRELHALENVEMYDDAIALSNVLLTDFKKTKEQEAEVYLLRALVYELLSDFNMTKVNLDTAKDLLQNYVVFEIPSSKMIGRYYVRYSSYNRMSYYKTFDKEQYNLYLKYTRYAYNFAYIHSYKDMLAVANMLLSFEEDITIEERLKLFQSTLNLWKVTGDKKGTASMYNNFAIILKDDFNKSMAYNDSALTLIKGTTLFMPLARVYEVRTEIFNKKGKLDSAFANYKLFRNYVDSINLQRKSITVKRLDNDALLKIKKLKNKQLQEDIERSKRFSTRLKIAVIIILMLSIILLILYLNIKKKKREIVKSRMHLAESLKQKSLMLTELNHRVKNNLSMILSLVQLQGENQENLSNKNNWLVLESRIQTMATAHKLYFYTQDNLQGSSINIQDYVNAIQSSIISMSDKKVDFVFNISTDDVSVENALPIGIILNELITNSIKHAENAKDIIRIKFDLELKGNIFNIEYSDNGETYNETAFESTGLFILKAMTNQMKGKIDRNGSHYTIILYKK